MFNANNIDYPYKYKVKVHDGTGTWGFEFFSYEQNKAIVKRIVEDWGHSVISIKRCIE